MTVSGRMPTFSLRPVPESPPRIRTFNCSFSAHGSTELVMVGTVSLWLSSSLGAKTALLRLLAE